MAEVFLTPSVAALLAQVNANPSPPDYSPAAQRAGLDAAMAQLGWSTPEGAPQAMVLQLGSGAAVHLFYPAEAGDDPLPLVIYTHGGSFFAGGAKGHGPFAAKLAVATRAAVALVDYRLAPEHRSPAALDDCVAGTRLLIERADALKLRADRLAIIGDSAGGALAAGTALTLRGETGSRLLVLVNPMTSPHAEAGGSLDAFATGYFATAQDFAAGWDAYRGYEQSGRFYDLLAVDDLSGLPPTIVLTNEADPVRDQGELFAERLSAAGVVTLSLRARGLTHASWLFPKALPEAQLLLATLAGAIRVALAD